MEEKQLWSEINKIIKRCERRKKRATDRAALAASQGGAPEAPSTSSRQRKYDVFMMALEDILHRDHEVNMDITLRGDMARAFHITLAIGKYLWNKDEDAMVQHIIQSGVEHVINEYNSEVAMKEARKVFKPILREILRELEEEGDP